ncbi:hypothetical protein HG535_0C00160 [Zygotorulaspora mrakii]|uniref:BED-type domain-containing protein n=1 Tax=Zygotorulaspora mrakii TaxID=42260 RepID=A0A7H9AZ34_ZYGMR|nr:uncharacterized protein HG535_0C00160 [Zygotorulaspora mrakii]QLG71670.1 hypothetical protein HG535_0C00160 [Zygotorulaspora mrakii]
MWVTKYTAEEPYAICKHSDCEHLFSHDGNTTSSNIIAHLRRNHKGDFELFQNKLRNMQPQITDFKGVISTNCKPFAFRKELLHFMSVNELKITLLNFFIETIIQFSTAEAPAYKKLLYSAYVRNGDYIRSRKGLVNLMIKYDEEFNHQMRDVLATSFN